MEEALLLRKCFGRGEKVLEKVGEGRRRRWEKGEKKVGEGGRR